MNAPFPASERPIRVLLIAEAANPALTSASLVGWSCARAVAGVVHAHIATEERNRGDFEKAGLTAADFTAVNARRSQGLAWRLAKTLSGGKSFGWSLYAVFSNLAYPFFERALWKQFEPRLRAGEFDVVHRITPLSPTTPSWIAKKLAKLGIPFVVGPLNGGVPWPQGFDDIRRNEKDWAGRLRAFYRLMPGVDATRELATAIITAARTTWREMPPPVRGKCVFIPENAIDLRKFSLQPKPARQPGPLRIAFVGRLVALKGVDMLLAAAAPLAREGRVLVDIIGDGPEKERLAALVAREEIGHAVRLEGWVDHGALQPRLQQSDVLGFPSVREFGGGAVLEAMALGLPPVVLDHGGPPELVPPGTGFVVPMTSRERIVTDLRTLFGQLADDPSGLAEMGLAAQEHVRQFYTWERKAEQIREVYRWVLGWRPDRPDWGMPMGFASGATEAAPAPVAEPAAC